KNSLKILFVDPGRNRLHVDLGQSGLKTSDVKVSILDERGEEVPVQFHVKEHKCLVSATFQHCGPHSLDLYVLGVKNTEECPITVIDKSPEIAISLVEPFGKQLMGLATTFEMDVAPGAETVMAVEILDPQGTSVPVALSHREGSIYAAEWVPKTEGEHT
uniref:A2M_N_2 domain-containing protein n=1 Tax=Steinernema glaseri TaxID=37863 RepID=A0A1I7ZS38_9BILA